MSGSFDIQQVLQDSPAVQQVQDGAISSFFFSSEEALEELGFGSAEASLRFAALHVSCLRRCFRELWPMVVDGRGARAKEKVKAGSPTELLKKPGGWQ